MLFAFEYICTLCSRVGAAAVITEAGEIVYANLDARVALL